MTQLKLTLKWAVMWLLISFAAAGGTWAIVWAGEHVLIHAATLKRVFSFGAFWLLVGCFIRLAWHLGSKFSAQAFNAKTQGGKGARGEAV
jgi:hypothetical protein